jgi:hypothetical protein
VSTQAGKPPLDDHAAMYIAASRSLGQPPCVGVVRRFDELLSAETVAEYAVLLASNPHGFGRRVVRPRVPGARPRWHPAAEPPPIRLLSEPVDPAALAVLLDEEASANPDPSRGVGWQLAAMPTHDGGTVVLTWLHHAYGDGRSILETALATPEVTLPQDATPAAAAASATTRRFAARLRVGRPAGRPLAIDELGDVVLRIRSGVTGSLRLGRDVAIAPWSPARHGELARLGPAVAALRRRDRSVGTRSTQRVIALASVEAADWDSAAARRGGSGNTLLLAVLANLLRGARHARGETSDRPLRILLPVDTRGRADGAAPRGGHAAAANAAIAAVVVLPGGTPAYGDLAGIRAATKASIVEATRHATALGSARPPGVVDAMQLLPAALTHRVATRVQASVDGVASNVGPVPEHVARLGPHTASDVTLLAAPMLTDLTVCLGRIGSVATLGVVADPARLGPAGSLRERVAEELTAWGLPAPVRGPRGRRRDPARPPMV